MHINLASYDLIVFDCDGVLLDSNCLKNRGFYTVARKFFSDKDSSDFLRYHKSNGGVSRYVKFKYLLENFTPLSIEPSLDHLLFLYSDYLSQQLNICATANIPVIFQLLKGYNANISLAIASGSDQEELRNLFTHKKLANFFDAGIYGSPSDKYDIFNKLFAKYHPKKVLFFGDSLYDLKVSKDFNVDFVFVSSWSDISPPSPLLSSNLLLVTNSLDSFFGL